MQKLLLTFLLLFHIPLLLFSQGANIPLNRDYYHLIKRYEIMTGKFSPAFHGHVKPLQRTWVAAFIDSMYNNKDFYSKLNERDKFNLDYLATDSWDWSQSDSSDNRKPFLKIFYRKKPDFLHVDEDNLYLHINPVFYFSAGTESESKETTWINTRGLEARGSIAKKLGFYTFLATTQAVYPNYVRQWIAQNGVVPGEGFWKKFKDNGVDYFTARGYVTFELIKKYLTGQFGFDQNFTGAGHRSLILSDFAPGYTYLKFTTKIWRFNYTNVFAQSIADAPFTVSGSKDGKFPKKFMASHHLSFNITDKINIGVFESVIMGDSTERFNISYLNPIIFYRALEHQGGSSDNVIVGMDTKFFIGHSLSVYGQVVLDEFFLKEIKAGNGWWGNKVGGQIGLEYINVFGLDNLDLQLEYNGARPYMHAHRTYYTNYAHYRQSLGHPLGGNFHEVLAILRYQILKRLFFTVQLNYAKYGEDDSEETNWGKNVMKSYDTREQEYGNKIGQGIATNVVYGDLIATYMWKHNLFFDLRYIYRNLNSEVDDMDGKTNYISVSMRWNIGKKLHDF